LQANRTHGASYQVFGKDSRNLLTEVITLYSRGALPLFYNVITGESIPNGTKVQLRDVYPYLMDVSAEWVMASGKYPQTAFIDFTFEHVGESKKRALARVRLPRDLRGGASLGQLKILKGFRKDPRSANQYIARTPDDQAIPEYLAIWGKIRPHLLYHPVISQELSIAAISGKKLQMFEEFPIALAFFHLSSVVRYKPEFLARIRDSRYWPLIASMQYHCLHKFLLLFWSYVQRTTIEIRG